MSDELTTSASFPLDVDGFLRRQCPECRRELKWRPTPEGEEGYPTPDLGYHCPYCDQQADASSWFTEAQIEHAKQVLLNDVGDSYLEKKAREIGASYKPSGPRIVDGLSQEPNDMRRQDFACHPAEPVKIAEDWSGPVHCLICGQPASEGSAADQQP